eukprot:TRINITY_DN12282_c0_g1_i1.p1 TRINITY_DN12282_c0_g1~~TRINITY_DN12282_c0_g1_i1.p1  ORF type:complete len:669 (+),score=131.86 TRINITY_DN12282_c0_g1_i1:168-2174(+)
MIHQTWHKMGLDNRLTKALERLMWAEPTPIQTRAIPLALQGKDILAKARTGSGKTGSYLIPIIQRTLLEKESGIRAIRALILVPTSELSVQVRQMAESLIYYSSRLITVLSISGDQSIAIQKPRLAELPDILVATPATLVTHLEQGNVSISDSLEMIVVDEADLILSYGYKEDLSKIKRYLPPIAQGFLMSATLSSEVEELKNLILHTPVIIEVNEEESEQGNLRQFSVECEDDDKFLLLYVMLKLKLIIGKTVIFVNTIDRCFRLKLFLERFSIRSAVLNSELPQNSRIHILQEFNKGLLNLLIATDERSTKKVQKGQTTEKASPPSGRGDEENETRTKREERKVDTKGDVEDGDNKRDDEDEDNDEDGEQMGKEDEEMEVAPQTEFQLESNEDSSSNDEKGFNFAQKGSKSRDKEYGVARGVDFKGVSNVINFDFPHTASNYVHRTGRTARAGKTGLALSLVTHADLALFERTKARQLKEGKEIVPYVFQVSIVQGFRYRVMNVLQSVTRKAVKQARVAEIKHEMLNSEKLKEHFKTNPLDLDSLKHDKDLQSHKVDRHLAYIPDYLMPSKEDLKKTLTPAVKKEDEVHEQGIGYSVKHLKRRADPLRTLGDVGRKRRRTTNTNESINEQEYYHRQKLERRKIKSRSKRADKFPTNQFKKTKQESY